MDLSERLKEADVLNLPDWEAAEVLNAPDLSIPIITEWSKTLAGYDAILVALGPVEGAAFLDNLEFASSLNSQMKWALKIIDKGILDLSLESVRQQILAATQEPFNLLTQSQAERLFSLSKKERHLSWAEYNQTEVTARTVGLARGGI